jgi:TctA family transporter
VTCLDGYQMARNGPRRRGAVDLGVGLVLRRHRRHHDHRAVRRTADAHGQKFGPADYCSLMALGLVAAVVLASGLGA